MATIPTFSFPLDYDEAKQLYRAWCMVHHPDRGGDTLAMQALTEAWRQYEAGYSGNDDDAPHTSAFAESFMEAIRAATAPGVVIELCGAWLWASGDTKPLREALKAAGWRWASKKLMWYYHEDENSTGRHRTLDIDAIRDKYGSSRISGSQYRQLPATA